MAYSQRPLDFAPGSKWSYCSPGIDTLGRIIEVVSDQPFESFLKERLFDPLQGLRISLGCLGAPGMSDLPLLSSPASWESDGFCTIDHQENSTSSGTSTP
jgi:hypothetical protein